MKKLIVAVMLMVPALLMAQENVKLGYINREELISSMPEYETALKQLEDMNLTYKQEGQKLQDELQKKFTEYQAAIAKDSLDPTIRQYKESELQRLNQSIEEFTQNAQTNLQKKQQELMTPILDKANKAIKQVGDENGYTYIMESGAGQILPYIGAKAENVMPLVKKVLNLSK
ncbi:MAG: OmpH family outer membrane protein [Paludibacteraceae bacterium]|nr:OmpH family outer membrane protein [Paludibacteraceae bacterium]